MIKKSSRIKYSYCGEQLNIKEIYCRNKKRRGRSKYLLSVDVMVGRDHPYLWKTLADITFSRSLGTLMDALMASLQEILKLSDEQLTAFTTDFEARLPEYLRNALHSKAVAA